MEELTAEVRSIAARVRTLTLIACFIAVTFVGMIVGLETAAGRAGPRLVEMCKRSNASLSENNRFRAELEAARSQGSPSVAK